jgi:hypothetical protein
MERESVKGMKVRDKVVYNDGSPPQYSWFTC